MTKSGLTKMKRPTQLYPGNTNSCVPDNGMSLIEALNQKKIRIGFRIFLESEFSVENLDFWFAVEDYKTLKSKDAKEDKMREIYEEYVSPGAPNQINLDHVSRQQIIQHMATDTTPSIDTFNGAQRYVFNIMENDSYARFVRSKYFDLCSSPGRRSPIQVLHNIFRGGKSKDRSLPSSRKNSFENLANTNNCNNHQKRLHGSDGNITRLSTDSKQKSTRAISDPTLSELSVFRSFFSRLRSK
uniref:regulator of G-protein signaling 1-like n=1 Tax=Styela clava TaxID=7725 RepID=UPI00193A1EDD|nr:regulator of G-protein signaling 1-like [Styela clava]